MKLDPHEGLTVAINARDFDKNQFNLAIVPKSFRELKVRVFNKLGKNKTNPNEIQIVYLDDDGEFHSISKDKELLDAY